MPTIISMFAKTVMGYAFGEFVNSVVLHRNNANEKAYARGYRDAMKFMVEFGKEIDKKETE